MKGARRNLQLFLNLERTFTINKLRERNSPYALCDNYKTKRFGEVKTKLQS